ncbi:MAG: methyltransferase [Rhodospirillaceae bacterium]|nr:methyltransferase [Rhodospirillaceae bacterium]
MLAAIKPETVTAPVKFSVDTGKTPVTLVTMPGVPQIPPSHEYESHDVDIINGRPDADRFELDREGFAFRQYDSAVKNFYDDDEVRAIYYPEMERLVAQATGASKVVVFDHTIRVQNEAARVTRQVRGPVNGVHNDFTVNSAPQRVRDLLPPDEAKARLQNRYGSVNIWRPLREPVQDRHLVICGYGDMEDGDLIASERRYGDRVGGVYRLTYNPSQRWHYFPDMMCNEIILLKCFDSLTNGTARWTAHGSFDDPNAPPNTAGRESIEIRTLYFFDN